MTSRNPAWAREELILALDLYRRRWHKSVIHQTDEEVVALSRLLNALAIHAERPDRERFRNANGVYMKLSNFARLDPEYPGKGLERGNHLEREVRDTFANDPVRRRAAVAAIEALVGSAQPPVVDDEEDGAAEGHLLFRQHRIRERSAALVARKKSEALRAHGRLRCEVCEFDFVEQYGGGEGPFIECHHRWPLSRLRPGQRTTIHDLALVCANCHRMLHRLSDPSDLTGLRDRLRTFFSAHAPRE